MGKVYRQRHYHNAKNCVGKFDRPWTWSERDLIMDAHRSSDRELAAQLSRTIDAIQAERRREKLRRQPLA